MISFVSSREQLKTQNLSDTSGKDMLKSENESVKSRLTVAQVKIENLKREREKIQQELGNFNERVTQLIIENNRLLAQHEASIYHLTVVLMFQWKISYYK